MSLKGNVLNGLGGIRALLHVTTYYLRKGKKTSSQTALNQPKVSYLSLLWMDKIQKYQIKEADMWSILEN